ncbi:hypothetical protein PsorP6_006064 [Peronosclerospora sorghi]|uniref:Uncharacterized protein n=1 Tax=Peronosclerospora sorghi TaxID=230839 RepID=A0ACC0W0K4_9STRA|nr:hypothetical protein PsorP6_006064 [Peronosclerospora sorghi]
MLAPRRDTDTGDKTRSSDSARVGSCNGSDTDNEDVFDEEDGLGPVSGKWPLSGKGETNDVPLPSGEACEMLNKIIARAKRKAGEFIFGGLAHLVTICVWDELKEKVDALHETKPRPVEPQDDKTSVTTVVFPPHSNPAPPNVVAVKKSRQAPRPSPARPRHFECTTVPPSHFQQLRDHTQYQLSCPLTPSVAHVTWCSLKTRNKPRNKCSKSSGRSCARAGATSSSAVAPPRNASRPAQTQALRVDKRVDNLPHIGPTVLLDGIRRTHPVHDRARPDPCVPHHGR